MPAAFGGVSCAWAGAAIDRANTAIGSSLMAVFSGDTILQLHAGPRAIPISAPVWHPG
jgi:hypothetical protein